MQRLRVAVLVTLILAWMALAFWQRYDYNAECRNARETLVRQADSLMQALTGGIRSHRRLGYFFADQLEGVLEELVATQDVLAAAVVSADGRLVCSAGADPSVLPSMRAEQATVWHNGALRYVKPFELAPRSEDHPGRGAGLGRGGGRGRGAQWMDREDAPDFQEPAPFVEGGKFTALLMLDAKPVAEQCRRAALTRLSIVTAGALVLFFLALVWHTTFRLAEARGREQLLESEARYLRELGQAAAGLAHETRNPLGLIRGWTQRLAAPDAGIDEPQQRSRAIVEECDRLTARINQFLAFARPAEPRVEDVPLRTLADELAALLEPDLQSEGIELDRTTLEHEPRVRADRELLRQALFNLVQNAVQASPPGGTVEMRLIPSHDGRWRLEVADRGPGVPSHVVDKLFTPYFTTRRGGTGLGLAIVRRIAVAHGWQAGYRARSGGGSCFWLDGLGTGDP